jgi:hypothetical protein
MHPHRVQVKKQVAEHEGRTAAIAGRGTTAQHTGAEPLREIAQILKEASDA